MARRIQLDSLRAIAVGMVAFSHWAPPQYALLFPFGATGVALFFVLSGYLITQILLDAKSSHDPIGVLRNFIVRRGLRIFPIYYLTIGALLFVGVPTVVEPAFWHLGYLTNVYIFLVDDWITPVGHFWTLAVEEQFYLAWPFVVLFLPRRRLMMAVLAIIVAAIVFRAVMLIFLPDVKLVAILPLAAHSGLAVGSLLAVLPAHHPLRDRMLSYCRNFAVPAFIVLVPILAAAPTSDGLKLLIHIPMVFSAVWLIERASEGFRGPVGYVLSHPVPVAIGVVSYGAYMFHNFAPYLLRYTVEIGWLPERTQFGLMALFLNTAITLAMAFASWHVIEKPINSLKRYFPRSPHVVASDRQARSAVS